VSQRALPEKRLISVVLPTPEEPTGNSLARHHHPLHLSYALSGLVAEVMILAVMPAPRIFASMRAQLPPR